LPGRVGESVVVPPRVSALWYNRVTRLDLAVHLPPNLVVEFDVTHPSLDKFPTCEATGVPEVWRYEGQA
jgi:Uma2 family endonuclease